MFGSRTAALIAALQAENSDLRSTLRRERDAWAAQNQSLVDRILALTAPGGLREVKRDPSQPRPAEPPATPRRFHYPGDRPSSYPALPAQPPQVSDPLTDAQLLDIMDKSADG